MKRLISVLAVSISLFCATPVFADAPPLINFQGKLTDANQAPVDGSAEIVCSVYDAAAGGTLLWSEQSLAVPVNKGIFNVLLGNGNPNAAAIPAPYFTNLAEVFAAYPEAWMEVEVNGEAMTPRQRLVSVAYSLHSETAVAAEDVPGKDITPNSVTIPAYGQVIDSLGQWTGATIPSTKLDEADPQVEAATVNRLSKWDGSALVDTTSVNETAAGNVGIGTNAPAEKLSVAGKVQASGGFVFPDGSLQVKAGVITETDPTVPAYIKNGISWNEISGIPSGFKDGVDNEGVSKAYVDQLASRVSTLENDLSKLLEIRITRNDIWAKFGRGVDAQPSKKAYHANQLCKDWGASTLVSYNTFHFTSSCGEWFHYVQYINGSWQRVGVHCGNEIYEFDVITCKK